LVRELWENTKIFGSDSFLSFARRHPPGSDPLGNQPTGQIYLNIPASVHASKVTTRENFRFGQFPPGVFSLQTMSLTFSRGKRKATFNQFRVTLAYTINAFLKLYYDIRLYQ
jgi:hypothetical protein